MTMLAATLLAQDAPRSGAGSPLIMMGLLVFMVVFFIVLSRGTRRGEEKKRKQLLESLKKNDRVLTHGGIIGTIVAIRDREVILKIDESTNTKMTFIKDAIRQVITDSQDVPSDTTAR